MELGRVLDVDILASRKWGYRTHFAKAMMDEDLCAMNSWMIHFQLAIKSLEWI